MRVDVRMRVVVGDGLIGGGGSFDLLPRGEDDKLRCFLIEGRSCPLTSGDRSRRMLNDAGLRGRGAQLSNCGRSYVSPACERLC